MTVPSDPGSGLTRTTINLQPRVVAALDRMVGDGPGKTTRSELVNRGVLVLEVVDRILRRSGGKLVVRHEDGSEETIYILF